VTPGTPRFSAVLFDCDGVLVDSEPITNGVLRTMLIGLGRRHRLDPPARPGPHRVRSRSRRGQSQESAPARVSVRAVGAVGSVGAGTPGQPASIVPVSKYSTRSAAQSGTWSTEPCTSSSTV
jgi:phosphoglycolate phosphatase-like HAD superfamily hydrolase